MLKQRLLAQQAFKQQPQMLDQLPATQLVSASLKHGDGTVVPLEEEYILVGRDEGAGLDLTEWDTNKFCSHSHAEILFQDGGWVVQTHQDATNPTKVNKKKVTLGKSSKLKDGDKVTFADIEFTFKTS